MRVSEVMTTDVVAVGPSTPLGEVVRLLLERHITGVPVVDDEGRVAGVVSESDLINSDRLRGRSIRTYWQDPGGFARAHWKTGASRAGEVMTRPAICVTEDRTVEGVATLMIERGIKRAPVVRDERLVGIVTRADVIRSILSEPGSAEAAARW